jgi:hypothetical protein
MLATARAHGRHAHAPLVLADARRLPLPGGRAALAARQGRRLRDDDLLSPGPLGHQLRSTGWRLAGYDDGPDRFLAVAERAR